MADDQAGPRSVMRSLDIFDAYRRAKRPLSMTEVARLADIPPSTCHGVMRALERNGFLYFVSGHDAYPTRRLWDMAEEIREHDPIALLLEAPLSALRNQVAETVILGARQGDAVVYLLVLESSQTIRYSSRAGDRKPLHSSSIGKVMLGTMSPAERTAWLSDHRLDRVTDRTITKAAHLISDLDESRRRGYYVTRGENVPDVLAVAAPIRLGSMVLGVAVAGPMHRMQSAEAKIGKRLVQCIQKIQSSEQR